MKENLTPNQCNKDLRANDGKTKKHRKGPSRRLLGHLAGEQRPKLSTKQMRMLTKSRYNLLPEQRANKRREKIQKEKKEE